MNHPTKQQTWAVYINWGVEHEIKFFAKPARALDAAHDAEQQGADVVIAETYRLRIAKRASK